jgi:glyoxalase family protein
MKQNPQVERHHHITLNVGTPQEDYDFHTKLLGMKSVKKTALYDGEEPVFHLYYGNDAAEESSLVTTFPMRQSGRRARPGSGTISIVALSVAVDSLPWWEKRLGNAVRVRVHERFGDRVLRFSHPCGIEYELVGVRDDPRVPYSKGPVPQECGVRGLHGIVMSARDLMNTEEFLAEGWSGKRKNTDGRYVRYELGAGGTGAIIDVRHDPDVPQGSWAYGEGVVHHCAFQVKNLEVQTQVKSHLEGLGYTDVSDRKDRGYFDSVYVRTPGGPLFEASVSKEQGFTVDEPLAELGKSLQIPPPFLHRKDELTGHLGPIPHD